MENYNIYLKKFKIALSVIAMAVVILVLIISKIVPEIQQILTIQQDYKNQAESLADSERKLENLRNSAKKKEVEQGSNLVKAFHKPITKATDTETAMSEEFGEILQIIRENKIKTRSINYEYDPQDDNFVKNLSGSYHVCRISAEMIANYASFANFLRDLYKHEHFLEISKIEIVPYAKNKTILLISLQFKLYAQKMRYIKFTQNPLKNLQKPLDS